MSFLTQSHQVFFGRPLCLSPSSSHVIQPLTQSLSSFRSTCNTRYLIINSQTVNSLRTRYDLSFLLLCMTSIQPLGCNTVINALFIKLYKNLNYLQKGGQAFGSGICLFIYLSLAPSVTRKLHIVVDKI